MVKFLACRKEYIHSEDLKKTVVLESLARRAIGRRKAMGDEGASDPNTPVPMEIDTLENQPRCFRCHRTGHRKADCHAKKMNDGKEIVERGTRKPSGSRYRDADPKKKKRCFNCNRQGHLAGAPRKPRRITKQMSSRKMTMRISMKRKPYIF